MSKRSIAVLVACFFTVLAAFSIRYSYGTLLPEMLPALSITKAEAGIIYSSYFIAYTVLSPILGIMSDRFDMRIILAVFMAVMGIGTFLMQYPTSMIQASLFFTIAGIGCSACWAPVVTLAQRWISAKRRGLGLSLIDAGSSLGIIVAGTLIPLVVASSGWQKGWMVLGVMGLLLSLVNYVFIRSSPDNTANLKTDRSAATDKNLRQNYLAILKDKQFWYIGFAYLLTGFAIIIPFTFLSTYGVQEMAISYESSTLLITIIGIGAVTGKLTLGPASDSVGRIKVLVLCAVLIAGGCLGIAYGSGGRLLMIVCFVYGTGYGACWALYAACAMDFFPKQYAGGIIGLWTFFLGTGCICGPIITGWAADVTGTLKWSFVMAGIAGVISLIFLLPMLKASQVGMVKSQP
jgi:MFS family permease